MQTFLTNLCLFPLEDKILAMFFSQQNIFRDVWESFDQVEEYCYWNNTDKPEDISYEDWKIRGRDWDKALDYSSIPSESGLIVELAKGFPSIVYMKMERACKHIPTFETRLNYYAKSSVIDDKYEKMLKEVDGKGNYTMISKAIKWFETEEAKPLFEAKKEELKKILLPEITMETLKKYLNSLSVSHSPTS